MTLFLSNTDKTIDELDHLLNLKIHDQQLFLKALNQVMPFGRYQGQRLIDIPEAYFVWFKRQGFPDNTLGREMALIYEIKLNGLESLVRPLIGHIKK